jgi:hypothetical protein
VKNQSFSTSLELSKSPPKFLKMIKLTCKNLKIHNLQCGVKIYSFYACVSRSHCVSPKKYRKKRSNNSDMPDPNAKFLCPRPKIFCANTYTSSIDMLLCHFIKSFQNFETVFDKISGKKNYKKKKKID